MLLLAALALLAHGVDTGLHSAKLCCGAGEGDCAVLASDNARAWALRDALGKHAQTFPPQAQVTARRDRLKKGTVVRLADGTTGEVEKDARPQANTVGHRRAVPAERSSIVILYTGHPTAQFGPVCKVQLEEPEQPLKRLSRPEQKSRARAASRRRRRASRRVSPALSTLPTDGGCSRHRISGCSWCCSAGSVSPIPVPPRDSSEPVGRSVAVGRSVGRSVM